MNKVYVLVEWDDCEPGYAIYGVFSTKASAEAACTNRYWDVLEFTLDSWEHVPRGAYFGIRQYPTVSISRND